MDNAESIEQKLEQYEKIIQICSESLPHLSNDLKNSSSKVFSNKTKNENSTSADFFDGSKNKNSSLNSSPENIVIFYFDC